MYTTYAQHFTEHDNTLAVVNNEGRHCAQDAKRAALFSPLYSNISNINTNMNKRTKDYYYEILVEMLNKEHDKSTIIVLTNMSCD